VVPWKRWRAARTAAACVAAFSLAGCAGPHPVDPTRPPTLDARDVLEFDIRGKHVALRSVTFASDSVSGVPWQYPTDPRESYPVANISQVKVTRATEGNTSVVRFVWVAFVGLGLIALILKQLIGDT
jgi:hypothetical protein